MTRDHVIAATVNELVEMYNDGATLGGQDVSHFDDGSVTEMLISTEDKSARIVISRDGKKGWY